MLSADFENGSEFVSNQIRIGVVFPLDFDFATQSVPPRSAPPIPAGLSVASRSVVHVQEELVSFLKGAHTLRGAREN